MTSFRNGTLSGCWDATASRSPACAMRRPCAFPPLQLVFTATDRGKLPGGDYERRYSAELAAEAGRGGLLKATLVLMSGRPYLEGTAVDAREE